MSSAKKRSSIFAWIFILLVVLCVALVAWQFSGGPNPHMSVGELGGLTPDEVIARLGPPWIPDPRKPDPKNPRYKPWTPDREADGGLLQFEYSDYVLDKNGHDDVWYHPHVGYWYSITFKDGHVADVKAGRS